MQVGGEIEHGEEVMPIVELLPGHGLCHPGRQIDRGQKAVERSRQLGNDTDSIKVDFSVICTLDLSNTIVCVNVW